MIKALFLTPKEVLFEGYCQSIILPGENGTLEILSYHKNFLSRLLAGLIRIDNNDPYAIRRGIVKVERNTVVIIAELAH